MAITVAKLQVVRLLSLLALMAAVSTARADLPNAGAELLLWPDGAPGAVGTEELDRPAVFAYALLKEAAPRRAVVITPGGGYGGLAMGHEGHDVAKALNSAGISAFIVRYRLAPRYRNPAPLQDAQRAVRLVRAHADEWGLDGKKIGLLGFSAGGHLASTVGTHFDAGDAAAADPIDRQSCRPDFLILAYPVITLEEPFTHRGSRDNLLGPNPDPKLLQSLCNDKQVTAETPPTFLFHTGEDTPVPAENSLFFYSALRRAGVPAELHIYTPGKHGVGLAPDHPVLKYWPQTAWRWIMER